MRKRLLTWGAFFALTLGLSDGMAAQRPVSNLSLGAGFAYNGSGPMGSVVLTPIQIGHAEGLQIGVGVGGWVGLLSNDAFESSNRHLYGVGIRMEFRVPPPTHAVSGFFRVGADIARSSVNSANFVPEPPLPGDPWDRTNGEGVGIGLEGGIAVRLTGTTLLQISGGYDRQWIYPNAPNNMWRVGIGLGKISKR